MKTSDLRKALDIILSRTPDDECACMPYEDLFLFGKVSDCTKEEVAALEDLGLTVDPFNDFFYLGG